MQKLFNKILVPVDFSRGTTTALERAVDLANEYHCDIHLLHVKPVSPLAAMAATEGHFPVQAELIDDRPQLENQLQLLAEQYISKLVPGRSLHRHIFMGLWNDVVIDFIAEFNIDLLLLGQREPMLWQRRTPINANWIAEKSCIPVISIPGNRKLIRLYSIVIPVTDFLPVKKLMYGVYMAQHHHTTIKLLGVQQAGNDDFNRKVDHYLSKSFRLIKDNCDVPVDIVMEAGLNIADTVKAYAQKCAADLVIINPGRQSRMPGILSALMGNVLQKYSIPPVLTISAV